MSDLHLETTRGWDLPPPSARPDHDALVVAGDLITRAERGVKWLLDRTDRPCIYVPGNHEAWGADIDRTVEKAMQAAEGTKVFVLQDRAVSLGDVTFAGCCLWSDYLLFGDRRRAMSVAGVRMNDFKRIRTAKYRERFLPRHALARHAKSRAFLEAEMRKPRGHRKLVVVTHHAPIHEIGYRLAPPRPDQATSDDTVLSAAYRSDLTELMWPQPIAGGENALRPAALWIFGHTHESEDVTIGSTRLVSNGSGPWKSGQTWENPFFDPRLVIEI